MIQIYNSNSKITLSRKRIYISLLFTFILLSCSKDDAPVTNDNSQVEEAEGVSSMEVIFKKVYGGDENDTFKAVVALPDGGYASLGDTQSINGDVTDNDSQINKLWLLKTDSNGVTIFSKTYGGSEDSRGTDIIHTTDGGFAILGYSESSDGDLTENNGFYDHWVIKVDAQGDIQWQKSFGFAGSDQAYSIIQTTDGGYFTAGFLDVSASQGGGNDDGLLLNSKIQHSKNVAHGVGEFWGHKLDANGNLVWRRYFGGSNNDRAYGVVEATDGGFLMIGNSESIDFDVTSSNGSYDFWAIRLDPEGNLLWEKSLGGSQIDIAYDVTATTDGNYLIVGDTRSMDGDVNMLNGNADVWVVKLSDQGELLWERSLGGTSFDTARSITPTERGYAITGASRSSDGQVTQNYGQNDIWIIQIDTTGNITSQVAMGGNGQDFGYAISVSDDSLIIAGETSSTSGDLIATQGKLDAVLIKLSL